MRFIHFMIVVFCGVLVSGCLTVSRGTTETFNIVSNPTGADVQAELLLQSGLAETQNKNRSKGLACSPTPCSLELPRSKHARISVSKNGYQSIQFLAVSKGSSPTSSIREGMIVAGQPPGSFVVAGASKAGTRYISGNTLSALQILTLYGTAGTIVDSASGANRSLSPNPVTVELAPLEQNTDDINNDDKNIGGETP